MLYLRWHGLFALWSLLQAVRAIQPTTTLPPEHSTYTHPPYTQTSGEPTWTRSNPTDYPGKHHASGPYEEPPQPDGLKDKKPNFIMFMPDQLRYDAVGYTGNKIVKTPNLDAFAEEGTRFTNIFAQASTCSQSRCSMFTGKYAHVSGHRTLENLLKPWEPNLFRSLKEGGYHVAYLSPRGDFYAPNATELGADEYGFLAQTLPEFASEDYDADMNSIWNRIFYLGQRTEHESQDYDEVAVEGALKWLEYPPQDRPWVLFLPLIFPHPPFTVEEPWFSMYNRSEMPLPADPADITGYAPRFEDVIRSQYGTYRATPEIWQEVKATYYGMVSRVDDKFGRIVNKTQDLGLWDSTITMFFTDHGEFLGDKGLVEKWPSGVSENLVHDPLLIGGGGLPKNVTYEEMAEMVDLVPTRLQLAQLNETYAQYGLSLVEAMLAGGRGEVIEHKAHAFAEGGFLIDEEPLLEQGPFPYDIKGALQHDDPALVGKALGIRNKEWTYVLRLYEDDELYSRKGDDPHELYNLAGVPEHQGIRAEMRETALHWLFRTPNTIPWYINERVPAKVDLEEPYDQYVMRKKDQEHK